MSDLPDFQKLRHNPKHHLGLGDVRITVAQQEAIEQRIAELESLLDSPPTARAATREARFIKEIAELKKQVTEHESRDSRYWHSIQKRSDGQAERITELESEREELRATILLRERAIAELEAELVDFKDSHADEWMKCKELEEDVAFYKARLDAVEDIVEQWWESSMSDDVAMVAIKAALEQK